MLIHQFDLLIDNIELANKNSSQQRCLIDFLDKETAENLSYIFNHCIYSLNCSKRFITYPFLNHVSVNLKREEPFEEGSFLKIKNQGRLFMQQIANDWKIVNLKEGTLYEDIKKKKVKSWVVYKQNFGKKYQYDKAHFYPALIAYNLAVKHKFYQEEEGANVKIEFFPLDFDQFIKKKKLFVYSKKRKYLKTYLKILKKELLPPQPESLLDICETKILKEKGTYKDKFNTIPTDLKELFDSEEE